MASREYHEARERVIVAMIAHEAIIAREPLAFSSEAAAGSRLELWRAIDAMVKEGIRSDKELPARP